MTCPRPGSHAEGAYRAGIFVLGLGIGPCALYSDRVAVLRTATGGSLSHQRLPYGFRYSTPSTSGHCAFTNGSSQSAINAISAKLSTTSTGAALRTAISLIKRRSDRARPRSFAIFSNEASLSSGASLLALAKILRKQPSFTFHVIPPIVTSYLSKVSVMLGEGLKSPAQTGSAYAYQPLLC